MFELIAFKILQSKQPFQTIENLLQKTRFLGGTRLPYHRLGLDLAFGNFKRFHLKQFGVEKTIFFGTTETHRNDILIHLKIS